MNQKHLSLSVNKYCLKYALERLSWRILSADFEILGMFILYYSSVCTGLFILLLILSFLDGIRNMKFRIILQLVFFLP